MLCAVTIPKKNQDQVTTKNRKIWTYLFDNLELRVNINPVYIYKYYITTQNKWTKWSVNSLLRIRWGTASSSHTNWLDWVHLISSSVLMMIVDHSSLILPGWYVMLKETKVIALTYCHLLYCPHIVVMPWCINDSCIVSLNSQFQ